jgi:hypothetical protein
MDVAYKIISHSEFKDTEDEVNALLKEHWELHGDLKVISGTPNTYAQAMVQREHYGGNDYNLSIQIDDLDDIKYALKEIAEAIETAATGLGHIATGLSDRATDDE